MINRRIVTSGLLASLATGLGSCGGSVSLETPPPGGKSKKKQWQPFSSGYSGDGPITRARRTTPATVAELMEPGPLKEMTLGRASAKVTVIEYFSLTCPVCHAFHKNTWPAFKKKYIDSGKIFFIAREFPIGRSSGNASIAIRCDEDNYFKLLNLYLAQQRRWVSQDVRLDAIHKIAAPYGLTRAKFDTCLANQALIDGINKVKQRGRDLGVIGTPTFFINGKQLRGAMTMDRLSAEIDPYLV
jgi:protein-disulfide isomerase